jgi:DNA-binding response OmpR family regulator
MKKILIVEDDKDNREELSVLLSCSGYEPVILDKYDTVTSDITSVSPDLVLLDIDLPSVNGKDILRDIRKKSNVPVIMVTGSQREADEIFSFGYGCDDYVTKPIIRLCCYFVSTISSREHQVSKRYLNITVLRSILSGILWKMDPAGR